VEWKNGTLVRVFFCNNSYVPGDKLDAKFEIINSSKIPVKSVHITAHGIALFGVCGGATKFDDSILLFKKDLFSETDVVWGKDAKLEYSVSMTIPSDLPPSMEGSMEWAYTSHISGRTKYSVDLAIEFDDDTKKLESLFPIVCPSWFQLPVPWKSDLAKSSPFSSGVLTASFELLSLTVVAGHKLWIKFDLDNRSSAAVHKIHLLLKERFTVKSGSHWVHKECVVLKKDIPGVEKNQLTSGRTCIDIPADLSSSTTVLPKATSAKTKLGHERGKIIMQERNMNLMVTHIRTGLL